jgi:iron complex transport system permease protein
LNFSPASRLLLLAVCVLLTLLLSLGLGSIRLSPAELWSALTATDNHELAHSVVTQLRLPRALNCFALGGLLALAGMMMQVLLRNPLADPYVLGTSGGAAVSALVAMLLGLNDVGVQGAAALGAFGSIVLVFAMAHAEGSWSPTQLLLSGVVYAAGASALVSLLLALGDDAQLRGMLFWLMGDISLASHTGWLWSLLIATLLLMLVLARQLNVLARGELMAGALGMDVRRMRIGMFALTALITAAAVTSAGSIGFIGLLTPHLGRLWVGADHRRLTPVVVVLGGCLLTLADTAARTLFAPRQLPVGALTAMLGVPMFLLMMLRRRGR